VHVPEAQANAFNLKDVPCPGSKFIVFVLQRRIKKGESRVNEMSLSMSVYDEYGSW
jgi:hypothetical protein